MYAIHVELLNSGIIALNVNPTSTLQSLHDQVRQYHATCTLNWPSTHRRSHHILAPPTWSTPPAAALRLSHLGLDLLTTAATVAESGIGPGSHLHAHMYFSQCGQLGDLTEIQMSQHSCQDAIAVSDASNMHHERRRTKHALAIDAGAAAVDEVMSPYSSSSSSSSSSSKRRKFNEPSRNLPFHWMQDLCAGLETTEENAARYGLDVEEMRELLEELDGVDGGNGEM